MELKQNLNDLHEVEKIKIPFFKERNVSEYLFEKLIVDGKGRTKDLEQTLYLNISGGTRFSSRTVFRLCQISAIPKWLDFQYFHINYVLRSEDDPFWHIGCPQVRRSLFLPAPAELSITCYGLKSLAEFLGRGSNFGHPID